MTVSSCVHMHETAQPGVKSDLAPSVTHLLKKLGDYFSSPPRETMTIDRVFLIRAGSFGAFWAVQFHSQVT